jgi:hypothetical protein
MEIFENHGGDIICSMSSVTNQDYSSYIGAYVHSKATRPLMKYVVLLIWENVI